MTDWREHGVRVVHAGELDPNTAQTPGMSRAAAIDHARAGARKLWAGTVTIHPSAKTGAHHHQEPVVVNLDIQGVEQPQAVEWVDPIHGTRRQVKSGAGDLAVGRGGAAAISLSDACLPRVRHGQSADRSRMRKLRARPAQADRGARLRAARRGPGPD